MPSNSTGVVGRSPVLRAFGAEAVDGMGTIEPVVWIWSVGEDERRGKGKGIIPVGSEKCRAFQPRG